MRKQILLVEGVADIRASVEAALRQAGYEVVSVDSVARAEGILSVSRFHLTIVSARTKTDAGSPFYCRWTENPERAGWPFLVLCSAEDTVSDLPDEVIVRFPFEALELVDKVKMFAGEETSTDKWVQLNKMEVPSGEDSVGQELDSALGLDQIEVKESEEMSGGTSKITRRPPKVSMVGFEADSTGVTSLERSPTDTAKIDLAFLRNKLADMPHKRAEVSDTDKLHVASHAPAPNLSAPSENPIENPKKTGAVSAPVGQAGQTEQGPDHNFEWFASEMQEGAASAQRESSPVAETTTKQTSQPTSTVSNVQASPAEDDSVFEWDGSGQKPSAEIFSEQMADAVARRVAERLMKQLNSDKFLQLVQEEIRRYLKER